MPETIGEKQKPGSLKVASAFIIWGLLPIFWNLLEDVNPVYILAQRMIWAMLFVGLYILFFKKVDDVKAAFRSKKIFATCFLCGILITVNWGVYIYAVNSGHVLEASMGYFIEPVLVALIGLIAFREQPSKLEKITFLFAVAGLVFLLVTNRTFPFMALIIAGSFAIYGAVKKNLPLTAEASLFMETLCMLPFALIFTIYADTHGIGSVGVLHGAGFLLLPASGLVTFIPMLLFNMVVKEIPYYITGILEYISPSMQFLLGLLYFHEALDLNRLTAFIIIWIGIIFTIRDKVQLMRKDSGKTRRQDPPRKG